MLRLLDHQSFAFRRDIHESNRLISTTGNDRLLVTQQGDTRQRRLSVRAPDAHRATFAQRHSVSISERRLNLEEIYPLLLKAE